MSKGGFQRVEPLGEGLIRGPARVMIAPITAVYPSHLGAVINLATTGYKTEEQELTKLSEEAKEGTLSLGFAGYETAALNPEELTAEKVQAALEKNPEIGEGGVKCSEGPLKEKGIKIKFAGELAEHAQPLIVIAQNTLKKEAEKPALTEVKRIEAGLGLYDAISPWTELGSTNGGTKITRNNTEDQIEIDQVQAALLAVPNEWEMTVDCPLAETTFEHFQIAWEGGAITTDITREPNERHIGIGNPPSYTERRMAIIHQKRLGVAAGKIRAHFIRRITRSPATSQVEYMKTGKQQILPLTFRAFADPAVANPEYSMGEIVEQSVYK